MKTLEIKLGQGYPIYIGENLLNSKFLADYLKRLDKRLVIITDSNLVNSLGKNLQNFLRSQELNTELFYFPAGEAYKSRETKQQLEDQLLEKKCGRDTCMIALGGGVVTDLVGFIAATYCRGTQSIYIPTTLLAMVDASIGGKTGVNTAHGKNLIGAFYQPNAVFMDIQTLDSLPKKEWANGIVEMIKHSVISDSGIFSQLEKNVDKIQKRDPGFLTNMIYTSCQIKKNVIEQDEKDLGIRQILNFGHTIGHAIETVEDYQISHGEAVAMGMLVEGYLSSLCGFLQEADLAAINAILKNYGLSLQTKAFQNINELQKILVLDKKAKKNISQFVLLDQIGKPHYTNQSYTSAVEPKLLNQALEWAAQQFTPRKI